MIFWLPHNDVIIVMPNSIHNNSLIYHRFLKDHVFHIFFITWIFKIYLFHKLCHWIFHGSFQKVPGSFDQVTTVGWCERELTSWITGCNTSMPCDGLPLGRTNNRDVRNEETEKKTRIWNKRNNLSDGFLLPVNSKSTMSTLQILFSENMEEMEEYA